MTPCSETPDRLNKMPEASQHKQVYAKILRTEKNGDRSKMFVPGTPTELAKLLNCMNHNPDEGNSCIEQSGLFRLVYIEGASK